MSKKFKTAFFKADYARLTGVHVENFVCPITMEEVADPDLCDGHLLNQGIKNACRLTVPQRRDVDNYFGHTIEPDLVKFLNFIILSPSERIHKSDRISITMESGEQIVAFPASPKASKKFQQVDLLDANGSVLASRFLRSHVDHTGIYHNIRVDFTIYIDYNSMIGALLKSAYLALFKVYGYGYALDKSGGMIRMALSGFFAQGAMSRDSGQFFGEFENCLIVGLNDSFNNMPDAIKDRSLIMHYANGAAKDGMLFAITCPFKINDRTVGVILPAFDNPDAGKYYEYYLQDRSMPHSAHVTQFKNGTILVQESPIPLKYFVDHSRKGQSEWQEDGYICWDYLSIIIHDVSSL